MNQAHLPTVADVHAAAGRIAGVAVRTPLLNFPLLDAMLGGRVYLKPEILQRTGSFKFRGAYNRIAALPPERRQAGVVACSSGNHAQGVAHAATLFAIPSTIVMPKDAPALKIARTRAFGAAVVLYDRLNEDRDAIARAIAENTGATFIPPYDDPFVIAGQGTAGLEAAEDLARLGVEPDQVLVCCSGGGFTAGVALAMGEAFPATQVLSVEPEGFDDHARSFAGGQRQRNAALAGSICDALMAATPGEITFAVNVSRGVKGLVVSEDEVVAAIAFAFRELKLVVEPGGAVALAALLAGRIETQDRVSVAMLSGGNVDPADFAGYIRR